MAKRSRRSEPVYSRTPVEAERGVCAGGHPAVADAGIRIMQEGGGNAFDALAGAAFTAFVVEPAMCGLGGYARISAYAPDRGGFLSFDGYARAPLAATPHMFEPDGSRAPACYGHPCTVGDRTERGFLAAAVPGAVAGCCDAHAMLGRLPLAQVMAHAIEAAQQGIEIAWFDLLALAEVGRHLDAFPDTQAVWMPGGALPSVPYQSEQRYRVDGTALAGTLRRIAARGKRGFYAGRTAKAIDAYVRSHGGILESADLDAYRTRILREWPQRYRNLDYITCFDQVGYEALNRRLPDRGRGAARVHERRRSPHAHPARDRSPARALPGTRDLRGCADTRGSSAPPLPRGTRGRRGGGESGQPALRPRCRRHPGTAPRCASGRCGAGVAYLRGGVLKPSRAGTIIFLQQLLTHAATHLSRQHSRRRSPVPVIRSRLRGNPSALSRMPAEEGVSHCFLQRNPECR